MKSNDSIEFFGEILMRRFRDKAIDSHLLYQNPDFKDKDPLHAYVVSLDEATQQRILLLIMQAISAGMHDFLYALANDEEVSHRIKVLVDGQDVVNICRDGLNAEVEGGGDDGWESRYSKYPSSNETLVKMGLANNYLDNLKLPFGPWQ